MEHPITEAKIDDSPYFKVEDGSLVTIAGDPTVYEAFNVRLDGNVRSAELRVFSTVNA